MIRPVVVCCFAVPLIACAEAGGAESLALEVGENVQEVPESAPSFPRADEDGAGALTRLPFAGYLDMDHYAVAPACSVVLIAPQVAVTAASCVSGEPSGFMHVGFGLPVEGRTVGVDSVVAHPDAGTWQHSVAVLLLKSPITDVPSAPLSDVWQETCDGESVSYGHAHTGPGSERWSWSGCLAPVGQAPTMTVEVGAPNCHGDLGAGAFLPTDGHGLVGIVTAAQFEASSECVTGVGLAPVAENLDFLRPFVPS